MELVLQIYLYPFNFLVRFPYIAFIVALFFAMLWLRNQEMNYDFVEKVKRNFWIVMASVAWLIYGIHESIMYFWAQKIIGPIRIDLLLMAPFLYLLTACGLFNYMSVRKTGK